MIRLSKLLISAIFVAVLCLAGVGSAMAGSMTCPGTGDTTDREATLADALDCTYGEGNAGAAEVNAFAGSSGWFIVGELEEDSGSGGFSQGLITINITTGEWGDSVVGGTWSLPSGFWDTHSRAIISIHVGNGGGSPDHFLFDIDPGILFERNISGTWSIDGSCCGGGGLSNFKLWVQEVPEQVPEPTTLLLFGAGLIGLGLCRRRMKAKA